MIHSTPFRILTKREVAPETYFFEVEAPLVARARRAGQFMIITPLASSERIPISLAGGDRVKGTVHFAIMRVGRTSAELCDLNVGDEIFSILGPLGEPTHVSAFGGTVLCIGGGYGAGAVVPIAEEARRLGNRVIGVVGARDSGRLLFVDEMRAAADDVVLATEDGSSGRKGRVTDVLSDLLAAGEPVKHVYAIGPVPMMRALAEQTRPLGIGCTVSLNAIMVDGTGMCGGCRVSVGGHNRFACFDGPDFDAHQVDFDLLTDRQKMYLGQERDAMAWLAEEPDPQTACEHAGGCHMDALVADYEARWAPRLPENMTAAGVRSQEPPLTAKDRLRIPRQTMPEQEAAVRVRNFEEVAMGLTEDQAIVEAARCLNCKKPFCIDGCPVNIEIPSFLGLIAVGDFAGAARKVRESNCLPAISGRVCPQEKQCEAVCTIGKKGEAVAIGRLERFVADWERTHPQAVAPAPAAAKAAETPELGTPKPQPRRVAIVGSGPAGLTVAGELARRGHAVTVFEALHKAGGVLIYGIPEFRLPNTIVEREVENLKAQGVEFVMGALIGRSVTLEELLQREGYDAVFIGCGAGLPRMMEIPGENLKGVYAANEFLTRINLMRSDLFPARATPVMVGRDVVVVGAGNTAMDCVRTARRMGAEHVTLLYRRTEAEMPARAEELEHAKQEGVQFVCLAAPIELLGNDGGWVQEIDCQRMCLGEPDASGRRRPEPVAGETFRIPATTVVSALGFGVNPLLSSVTPQLAVDKRGVIIVDENRMTSLPGVFAGGDATTGGATVILAMGQGKQAAAAMDKYLAALPPRSEAEVVLKEG